ncbi:kinase domain protein (macronuclear) [Tetrahymena thermophila SB210]|uniref:non-specific serine/threonine protein kinase n=1 Tax=Tetrahymena thermophila (strain SB210) TaxID=312017 RepID=Q238Y2_TETTS|nr:kinase domain protein [Tetrahymena thermophila SB210]EAR93088.2 kinase domain protein [Tetrahymena thermophila SB210]|eukprot:XP_001013333.2 kinase domain protein [Tetrahymena thermophila SB210]
MSLISFFQIQKFNQSSIVIGENTYPQTLPIFWNSNGISSKKSFQSVSQELEVNGGIVLNQLKYIDLNPKQNLMSFVQSELGYIILYEDENDELEDILTNGNNSFIVNTQKNSYVIEDNLITKILPQTNVYLFLCKTLNIGEIYEEIQDISEEVQKYADFPKFNYNFQIDYYNNIMSYRDPFSENEQRIDLLIFRRSKKTQEIRAQTEDLIYKQVIQISRQEFQKKYELNYRDSIGCGSFGQVYKVKNKYKQIIKNPDILQSMPDYYACKQIHISQDGENQSQQIFHEIEVLEKLRKYENVIKLQNYIIEERSTYLVLDLAESTLQDKINEKQTNSEKFDESEIVKFLSQIGKTLALIYIEEGIAHRDIKPSNILIKDDNFYLSDFGCAEILFESHEARNNLVMGTLKWMSPELKEMKKNQVVDYFKSDIFSLGMLLLYMLTLSDISSVNSDEFTKNQKIRIMKNYCKGISNEIILLIKRMLETNPDNRPDAAIIINAIQDIENNFKQKNLSKDL